MMIYLPLLAPVLIGYLVLVRVLRYRRIEQIQKQHGYALADAQTIIGQLVNPQRLTFLRSI
jgi:hypothetical protein